jgi:predicted phage tail protein
VNLTAQGNPVPLLYGELIIGSSTISAGVYSEDQQAPTPDWTDYGWGY